ncbi:MAG: hypothetical protein EP311_04090 [Cytophagales bacterium]|nr:MAG: hypothetical protein EP311_04090 [Cytophagales bacterium]
MGIIRRVFSLGFFLFWLSGLYPLLAQQNIAFGIETIPSNAEGSPIRSVLILLEKDGKTYLADSTELAKFTDSFEIRPGGSFRQFTADLALEVVRKQPEIKSASYRLYNTELGGPVTFVLTAEFLEEGDSKEPILEEKARFPLISQTEKSKLTWLLNGGGGFYHEQNGLFAQGAQFTQGNPVATDPAGLGPRFWGEFYIEPGLAGITQLGKSKIFPYASVSFLLSGRNSSDIYSAGATAFGAVERLYGGILLPRLGKNEKLSFDLSAGRQFFQLNDGFLFAKFSGSANAGERGSVYLNSRTTFQMTGLAKIRYGKFHLDGFFLEPQELFKDRQTDTRYLGSSLQFQDNKHWDLGLSYISIINSLSQYSTTGNPIPWEGLRVINPKLWINNLGQKGIFLKSEFAYQTHADADMKALGWYIGGGLLKKAWKGSPSFYYRFAYMQGDDPATPTYERYDALLTGGLGNWVQGLNFRKISGDGNFLTHRVEVKGYLKKNMELSLDYFHFRADQLNNQGGLPPINSFSSKSIGQEVTATFRYFFAKNYLFLGIFTWGDPGKAITENFETQTPDWLSFQGTVFLFF